MNIFDCLRSAVSDLEIFIGISGGLARRDTGKNPGGPGRRVR